MGWVRKRALRGGMLRPLRVRPSAWQMLGIFFGLMERAAAEGDEVVHNVLALELFEHDEWPDEVVALFGPALRPIARSMTAEPAELLAEELNGIARVAPVRDLRLFEPEVDGHDDHHHGPAPPGDPLPEPFAAQVDAVVGAAGPWDAERAAALADAVEAAIAARGRNAWPGLPREVDPEARVRFHDALARYRSRTAY